ncbi:MAG: dodecin domain-containing protein [Methanotrichaceae archaeon]|nr:dodecin domain-containing protein [Methanotrichaceae archaeon]
MAKVYDFVELVGTSPLGWEQAVHNIVATASQDISNLRVAEVTRMDARIEEGKIVEYRVRVKLSFKYEAEPETL